MLEKKLEYKPLKIRSVNPNWSIGEMLGQDAHFPLNEVAELLGVTQGFMLQWVRGLSSHNCIMGHATSIAGDRLVNMTIFRELYPQFLHLPFIKSVNPDWDANDFLAQEGIFFLAHAAKVLPFTYKQLTYHSEKCNRSREVFGIWKDPSVGYLIDVKPFTLWLRCFWKDPAKKNFLE